MYYKAEVCKMTELDNFKTGCDPKTCHDFGVIYEMTAPSIDELKAKLSRHFDLTKFEVIEIDPDDHWLECSLLENDKGETASPLELQSFKNGQMDLYNANYTIYISTVTETRLNNTGLALFNI
jgi:hypothetical protein